MAKPSLRYPLDRIEATTDFLSVRVIRYEPPGVGGVRNSFQSRLGSIVNQAVPGNNKNLEGTILLPIPDSLQDSNAVSWTGDNLNPLVGAGIDALQQGLSALSLENIKNGSAAGEVSQVVNDTLTKFGGALTEQTRKVLSDYFVANAVSIIGGNVDPTSIITRETGLVLNPNLELLFKGPKLRTFNFNFTLTPRSRQEGLEVKSIINTFKKRMAPKNNTSSGGDAGIFIASPDVFELEFRQGGKAHPFLFKMKTCALNSCQVNYTDGTPYMTYWDGTPVKMSMSLSLTELNPVYAGDYNENLPGANEGVGF